MREKGNNLTRLQEAIIRFLAKEGASTINEAKESLNEHYKSTWIAFKNLEAKGLIRKSGEKIHCGRKYPLYWLTEKGIFTILTMEEGISLKSLIRTIEKQKGYDLTSIDLTSIEPFIRLLEDAPPSIKRLLKDIFTLIFESGLDLNREITKQEAEAFSNFINSLAQKSPEIHNFITAFLKLRQKIKSSKKEGEQA